MFKIKFDVVESVSKATGNPAMVTTREGNATAEEITRMLYDPRVVKITAKRKGFKMGKPFIWEPKPAQEATP